jgi:hypothetical protein
MLSLFDVWEFVSFETFDLPFGIFKELFASF